MNAMSFDVVPIISSFFVRLTQVLESPLHWSHLYLWYNEFAIAPVIAGVWVVVFV